MHIVYITAPSRDEAIQISNSLVSEGLAACTNIFNNITSVYKWEGEIREDSEVVIIAKTTSDKVKDLINRVKELHSYDCPCAISIKTDDGSKEFLKWVEDSCKVV